MTDLDTHERTVLSHYAPMFDGRSPVLDLGSRGPDLANLLAERGIETEAAPPADVLSFLERDPAPGPFTGIFCGHLLHHHAIEDVTRLLAGVRRVLAPGGVFVAVVPNPNCLPVLAHDIWGDPEHHRFYNVSLLARMCEEAGLRVEEAGPNPADHPGPPPGTEANLTMVDDDLARRVATDVAAVAPNRLERLLGIGNGAEAAGLAGHVVAVLSQRLAETQAALRDLERAHRTLVHHLFPPNEVYVRARG